MNSKSDHSHHRHHHVPDESEIFKNNSLMSIKRRKQIAKVLNVILIILAIAVVVACFLASYM